MTREIYLMIIFSFVLMLLSCSQEHSTLQTKDLTSYQYVYSIDEMDDAWANIIHQELPEFAVFQSIEMHTYAEQQVIIVHYLLNDEAETDVYIESIPYTNSNDDRMPASLDFKLN